MHEHPRETGDAAAVAGEVCRPQGGFALRRGASRGAAAEVPPRFRAGIQTGQRALVREPEKGYLEAEMCRNCVASNWKDFPDPRKRGTLHASIGPGAYHLRDKTSLECALIGHSKNVAYRMTSLLAGELGQGTRDNPARAVNTSRKTSRSSSTAPTGKRTEDSSPGHTLRQNERRESQ